MLQAIFTSGVDELTVHGLTQWDKNQQLQITLSSLPTIFQVHYSYKGCKEAYVVNAESKSGVATVLIPNLLLQQEKDAVAWVYVPNGNGEETIKTIYLPITPRAKPSDYAYTEIEIQNVTAAVNYARSMGDYAYQKALKAEEMIVDASGLAGDSNKLGGKLPSAYAQSVDGVLTDNKGNISLNVVTQERYYNTFTAGGAGDVDYITDTFALVPISASANAELFDALGNTGGYAYVKTSFYSDQNTMARRYQEAFSYNSVSQRKAWRSYGANGWQPWQTDAQRGKVILPNGTYSVGAALPFADSPDNYDYMIGRVSYAGCPPVWGGGSGDARTYTVTSTVRSGGNVQFYIATITGTYNTTNFTLTDARRVTITSDGAVSMDVLSSVQIGAMSGCKL